jgi:YVTN family beta-propeller protein
MRYSGYFVLVAVLVVFLACSTGPSGPGLTPSTLSVEFSGDSSKVISFVATVSAGVNADNAPAIRTSGDPKGSCEITVSWTICAESGFQSYVLYRSENSDISSDPSSADAILEIFNPNYIEYIDTEIDWATRYHYALETIDIYENGVWSNEDSVLTPGTAPTPSVLESSEVTLEYVKLNWSLCPDGDFHSYSLFRSDTPNIQADTSIAIREYRTSHVDNTDRRDYYSTGDATYYYALMTLNNKGLSSWSNEIEVYVPKAAPDQINTFIDVGGYPGSICCLPSGDFIYVANSPSANNVSVIRTSDNTVAATVNVGGNPIDICSLPNGDFVYVSNYSDDNVSVIRTSDNTVAATVAVGDKPVGICSLPNGDYIYVVNYSDGNVSVIRTSDNTVVATVAVGSDPFGICSLPNGDFVYVVNAHDDNVSVIRTSDNTVVATVEVGEYLGPICAYPPGDYVYLIDGLNDHSALIMRTSDYAVAGSVDLGRQIEGICSLPSGDRVYVTNSNYGYGRIIVLI